MRKIAAVALMATALGGCQSIFGQRAELEIRAVGGEETFARAEMAIAEGRDLLLSAQPGSAIVVLQAATGDASTSAEAYNMLGVAYAMLDRGDLAEGFFQLAIAQKPDEAKYAANLDRFYRSRDAAFAKLQFETPAPSATSEYLEHDSELAAIQPIERTIDAGPGQVRITTGTDGRGMTRVSAKEVSIRTGVVTAVTNPAGGRRRNPGFAALEGAAAAPQYPVRIDLASVSRHR